MATLISNERNTFTIHAFHFPSSPERGIVFDIMKNGTIIESNKDFDTTLSYLISILYQSLKSYDLRSQESAHPSYSDSNI